MPPPLPSLSIPHQTFSSIRSYFLLKMNSPTNSTSPPPPSAECLLANVFALDPQANVLRSIQLFLVFIFFLLFIRLLREYSREPVNFHGNFLLLFSNIVFVYVIYACTCFLLEFRYLLLNFLLGPLHSSPCAALIPIWWSALIRGPQYFEFFFMPLIHFAVMLERVRATLFVDQYEREGLRFGLISLLAIWLLSLLFALFIFLTMLMDNGWDLFVRFSFTSLVSPSNSCTVLTILYAILAIIFVTIFADLLVVIRNKKAQRSNAFSGYNLSRVYQINENIVTMRLILPLDFCFGTLFLIYFYAALYLRSSPSISKVAFQIGYDWINSVMLLHGLITVFLYTKFIVNSRKRRKRSPEIQPIEQQREAYFRGLREQWSK